nr:hypothetical protein [Tanacetum cinerariifolium]
DSDELFQKLLKDLKELAEYDQSKNTDRPIFLNDNHPKNSSEENVVSKTNQEPPQDSDICQLIRKECCIEVPEVQKQKMEDTMFDLVKICHHKQFLCNHDDIDNLIESALDSKLLSINSINSQRLDKKEQEVENVEEQPARRRNRAEKSLQNFRVVHKSSIFVNSTSQISSVHAVTQIQSTKEPEHLLIFTTFSNPLFKDNDDLDSSNDESLPDEDVPLIREECSIEVPEQQKQKMEDTMFNLVKICYHKQFLCIHDDIDNLIESVLDSKLLSINSNNSQRLDKKEQEVKNVVEQPAERRNRTEKSRQNFRVVHKSSISFKNTSQISLIHSIAPIESPKEPEHLLSMGYEHLSITPETKSNEVTESNAENLLPILSKCEVTLENEIECDMPANDNCSLVFTTFSNLLFKDNDDLDSSNDESLPDKDVPAEEFKVYSNSLFDDEEISFDKLDPHCFNVESDFVESLLNRDTFIDFSSKFDFSGELAHIKPEIPKSDFDFEEEIRLIENLLYDNSFPRPSKELNAEIADTIIEFIPLLRNPVQDDNSQQEEIDIVTETDDVMPPSVENDDDDYDLLLEEVDLFISDNSIPSGIENVADNPEGDIRFLEELLIDN